MPIPEKIYECALDELENKPFRGLLARLIAEEGSFDKGKAKYLVIRAKELWTEGHQKAKFDVPDEDSEEEPNDANIIQASTIEKPFNESTREFGVIKLSKSEYQKKFPCSPYPFDEND
jgi:hypothetical protein